MYANRLSSSMRDFPNSMDALVSMIEKLASIQQRINEINWEALPTVVQTEVRATLEKERRKLFFTVRSFAGHHMKSFTASRRSVRITCGTFGWRFTPHKVTLENGVTEEDLVCTLKEMNLEEYVRSDGKLNRKALLKKRSILQGLQVKGLRYTFDEQFFIKFTKIPNDPSSQTRAKCTVELTEE